MRILIFISILGAAGCASLTDQPGAQSVSPEFNITGVLNSGTKEIKTPLTLQRAIENAGGLMNCLGCYERGGQELLWRLAGPAMVVRGKIRLRIDPEEFAKFSVHPGDVIYISHKTL
jgi:hypothetical protein